MIETLLGIACFLLLVLCLIEYLKLEQAVQHEEAQKHVTASLLYDVREGVILLKNIQEEVNTIRVKV